MMTRTIFFVGLIIFVAGIALIDVHPAPVSAGGFPCFLCHGINFEGSDIAPAVAGTKLTDEQIANQMRHPRGVMPAFGANEFPEPQVAIAYIRAQSTGMPTLALSAQQKSVALATIAAVAATRSAEYARLTSAAGVASPTPAPPSPTAAVSPTPVASAPSHDAGSGAFGPFAVIGAILIGIVAVTRLRVKR